MDNTQQRHQIVLDAAVLDWMVAHMLRSPQVFNVAYTWVEVAHFNREDDTVYRMLWAATVGYYNQYQQLPTKELLGSLVVSQMCTDSTVDQDTINKALSFLEWAYPPSFPDAELLPIPAIDIVRCFLMERHVGTVLQASFQGGMLPDNATVPSIVEDAYAAVQRFNTIRAYSRRDPVPDEWEEVAMPTLSTGVDFLDARMGGGTEPREVHVILGPTGVGKTTLGMQITCAMARQNYLAVVNGTPGAERKMHVFISYEDERRSMVIRALAYCARIDKSRLEHMRSYNELTRRGNLLLYERQMYGEGDVSGEYERMQEAKAWLNQYCDFADFSGKRTPGEPTRGYGGMREIRQYLDTLTMTLGIRLGVVVIDWAGKCVRRHIASKGGDIQREQPVMLSEFVGSAFDTVSSHFECPVFICHQIKGAVGISPTKKLTHLDAEGCSTFAISAWFAFVLGNKDEHSNTCLFRVTKTRRGESDIGLICRINGMFGEILDGSAQYAIDQATHRIVPRSELEHVASEPAVRSGAQATVPWRQTVDEGMLDGSAQH